MSTTPDQARSQSAETASPAEEKPQSMTLEAPVVALPAEASAVNTPMQMLDSAIARGYSPETLQQLMALHKEWEANEARKAYYNALAQFRRDPPVVKKNRYVSFMTDKGKTEYNHSSLDEVVRKVSPKLAPLGLSFHWRTEKIEAMVRVSCVITHEQGHSEVESVLEAGLDTSGGKNNVQALGSTTKYLQRYTLEAALGIASEGDDDDGAGAEETEVERISEEQAADIESKIQEVGANRDGFLSYFKIKRVEDLAKQAQPEAIRMLEKIAKRNRRGGGR